ncbi:cob(I)yrinic acid a,c-diamide adenosyltransferase [Alicyclobacillus macrosporangiidus]|jgi:cob(I)alamin adenosyltransferase|uniref:Corrinoid adenosyltransferase n=1 Tax=Alicyclobacillus macrosporangiidus TaxID=392015 RepID=A0A1I7JC87_9BACL|nr:cob(I)yrinic acid a,c-diamide adenosyltransferase [Alicyclobacillus macrosporangiidus]SFU82768.1 cob(I)alamin adenosyltransferase [Alicyclobacillus macrosporangiidus]
MRIYTRSGDEGQTSLIYGRRVSKASARVGAYGTLDEANSAIGLVLSWLPEDAQFDDLRRFLARVQRDLFDLGRDLATPLDKQAEFHTTEADVGLLERMIDRLDADNPPLQRFLLPGGHPAAAALHLARTIVRRAEREVVALGEVEPVQPWIRRYLNRLSDLLFVMARSVHTRTGVAEPSVDFQAPKPDPFQTEQK